ncbi:hypothetical protein [Frankia sp. R82]|nr:hypothetical protein [Frankia sp. R82]MCM3885284.1 hypothetical protein [Frankia sp. R82]
MSFDRVPALIDWGGLPEDRVRESLRRLGTEIAPALRSHVAHRSTAAAR